MAVLGAALVSQDAALHARESLLPTHFFSHAHSLIFRAMVSLVDKQVAVDPITLRSALAGNLDEAGGLDYLSRLMDGVPRTTNVEYYAGIVLEKARQRLLLQVCARVRAAVFEEGQTAAEIAELADGWLLDVTGTVSDADLVDQRMAVRELFEDLEQREVNKGKLHGIDTGLSELNDYTNGGWQYGDFVVLAARPSMGKTALALNLAIDAARSGKKVVFFSLEMSRKQIEYRLLSALSGVWLTRLFNGWMGDAHHKAVATALAELAELPIWIDDSATMTPQELRAKCRRHKLAHGLDLVIVDYLQLLKHQGTGRYAAQRNEQVREISASIKRTGRELNVPVIGLSQLRRPERGQEQKRPQLSDLAESAALEQDGDMVLFIHRDSHKAGGKAFLLIEKQRNGPTGELELWFERECVKFTKARVSETQPAASASTSGASQDGVQGAAPARAGRHVHSRRREMPLPLPPPPDFEDE